MLPTPASLFGVESRRAIMVRAVVVVWSLVVCAVTVRGEEPVVVALRGVRQVEVTIGGDLETFEVAVRMLPVRSFDKATNAQLNRNKAKAYGLQALVKHLNHETETSRAMVSGTEIISTRLDGKFFGLTLRIPRDGVSVTKVPVASTTAKPSTKPYRSEDASSSSSLLSRSGDLRSTIEQLDDLFDSEMKSLKAKKIDSETVFELAVVELEERTETQFGQLENELRTDKLLLSDERAELLREGNTACKQCLQHLRILVEEHDLASKKETP